MMFHITPAKIGCRFIHAKYCFSPIPPAPFPINLQQMKTSSIITTVLLCFALGLNAQERFVVVIDEIMSDPSPQVGLPAYEWIEVRNVSAETINLRGWRVGDDNGESGALTDFNLRPDSFLIICSNTAAGQMRNFGTTISVGSFPSLNNDGGMICLKNAAGKTIHSVKYSSAWYGNELKRQGGWSLEMMDSRNPCTGAANWTASKTAIGGSPGQINSSDAVNQDELPPHLNRAYTLNEQRIRLLFNEPVDSLSSSSLHNYSLTPQVAVSRVTGIAPLFTEVELLLESPLTAGQVYTIEVNETQDCTGNSINGFNKAFVGLPSVVEPGDLVINEILFNPAGNAGDFVEIYNRSNKIIDAASLVIANRNNGAIASMQQVSAEPRYIFPGDYLIVTESANALNTAYFIPDVLKLVEIGGMPSYPDDKGSVVLTDTQGNVIDEVNYHENWHFPLLQNKEGISLERMDPKGSSQQASNWHSAASTAGFATPGYKNSQTGPGTTVRDEISVEPAVCSPDNDGMNDVAFVHYNLPQPGFVCNITLFNAAGRPVRMLVRNALLNAAGKFLWDGLDENSQALPAGIYIVWIELFDLQGKTRSVKRTVVLASSKR